MCNNNRHIAKGGDPETKAFCWGELWTWGAQGRTEHTSERQGLNLLKLCFQGHLVRHHFPFDLCWTELQPVCLQWGFSIRRTVGWDEGETVGRKKDQHTVAECLWGTFVTIHGRDWDGFLLFCMQCCFPAPPSLPPCLHVHLSNIAFVQPSAGWHLEGASCQFSS